MVKQSDVVCQKKQTPEGECTLFVSGISYECTEQQLQGFFGQGVVRIKMPKYQDSGRCMGYAHVTFQNRKKTIQALKKNRMELLGRYLVIKPAKGQQKKTVNLPKNIPAGCRTVFVKNLPYQCTEDQVGEFFTKHCGPVENIRFAFNAVLKHFKGFCYLDFKYEESVKKAVGMNGKEFQDRALQVDVEEGKAKKGYHNYVVGNSKFGSN